MEKQGYRETIEFLADRFPGRVTISPQEAAEVMNCDIKTVYGSLKARKNPLPSMKLGPKKIVISVTAFARWLS